MEGISIIIPVFNKLDITRKCINYIREFNQQFPLEIVIVDNGSTDKTPEVLSNEKDITYIRNQENLGISKAYNHGTKIAKYDLLCFMHNDVFLFENKWILKIRDFILKTPKVGIVGLYGAKTLRRDGSFMGKTIVHSKKDSPSITKPFETVAVVDGLFMAMHRSTFKKIEGFNEVFPVHYYDKDISLKVLKNKFINYVLNISFEHLCATTRNNIEKDKQIRDKAQKKFIQIWDNFLPVDVTTLWEKVICFMKPT